MPKREKVAITQSFPIQLKRRGVESQLIVGDHNRSAATVDLAVLKAVARAHRCGADAPLFGLAANLTTQQAAILAFMDCFHLLSLVVLAGLPLAFFIRRF